MEKSGAKFKIFGHSTEIIWQSKIKGLLHFTSLITTGGAMEAIKIGGVKTKWIFASDTLLTKLYSLGH